MNVQQSLNYFYSTFMTMLTLIPEIVPTSQFTLHHQSNISPSQSPF